MVQHSFEADVSSVEVDLCFKIICDLEWKQLSFGVVHKDPTSGIRSYIQYMCGQLASCLPVTEALLLQDRMNSAFGLPVELKGIGVEILWVQVKATVDQVTLSAALHRVQRRQEMQLQAEAQEHQIQRVEAFRRRVLSKPDMALTYYFLENKGSADKASYSNLEEISRQVAKYDRETFWIQVAELLLEFLRDLTPDERRDSVKVLKVWLDRYDRKEAVTKLEIFEVEAERRGEEV
ncbi:hypothetical protein I0C86_03990 [Plantactinospora sp. S1510]|uniref:Uncharacterized protein n=1 Tax=Plantactinospora alkalitolerans TaxID=2789879 RepID=A0ABS0GQH7_9ACTN|nr:hypothetical protein [Plantactinospora alkalitolerans]MBF9128157.1 hypothetical protein [Plantactinospora alkalitolerans]